MTHPPAHTEPSVRSHRLAFTGWCATLVAAFAVPLWHLALLARSDLHSHALLIPLISVYLLFVERRRLPGYGPAAVWPAAVLAGLALALVVAALIPAPGVSALGKEGPTAVLVLAFVCLTLAGGFLCFGSRWMRAAALPMGFLGFMVPLPEAVTFRLEEALKTASTDAAAWFFDLAGIPALRDGAFFRLPGLTIEVARECSGLRSTYVLLMTSVVVAHLFLRGSWQRVLLVAAIIPFGVVRNGLRILTLGWLCVEYGPRMIHTWIHHRGGPVFFAASLVPLSLLLWVLWLGERRKRRTPSATRGGAASLPEPPPGRGPTVSDA